MTTITRSWEVDRPWFASYVPFIPFRRTIASLLFTGKYGKMWSCEKINFSKVGWSFKFIALDGSEFRGLSARKKWNLYEVTK